MEIGHEAKRAKLAEDTVDSDGDEQDLPADATTNIIQSVLKEADRGKTRTKALKSNTGMPLVIVTVFWYAVLCIPGKHISRVHGIHRRLNVCCGRLLLISAFGSHVVTRKAHGLHSRHERSGGGGGGAGRGGRRCCPGVKSSSNQEATQESARQRR